MLTISRAWLVLESVDMRLGINGLSLRIQQALGRLPCDGSTYLFRNRAGTRLKLLQWDGNGVWLAQRRLHRGRFVWPLAGDSVFGVTPEQFALAGRGRGLAASRGGTTGSVASITPWANDPTAANRVTCRPWICSPNSAATPPTPRCWRRWRSCWPSANGRRRSWRPVTKNCVMPS
ncbi:IS66 family insertion sequence element accessory protein TnpB [Azotobacter beijerinckii]|uniref:IS66 family insertion sequence element accessory protein TnpB n=1 Tax=Azotobacter beijerinckii TaxID=170623 RepID=UPI0020C8CBF1|nr:IS66 family insertion sequence element accessory protein TnpB [Azotobacter beijerinckii]